MAKGTQREEINNSFASLNYSHVYKCIFSTCEILNKWMNEFHLLLPMVLSPRNYILFRSEKTKAQIAYRVDSSTAKWWSEPKSTESSARLNDSITKEEDFLQPFRFFGCQRSERWIDTVSTQKRWAPVRPLLKALGFKGNVLLNLKKGHKQNYFHQYDCLMPM